MELSQQQDFSAGARIEQALTVYKKVLGLLTTLLVVAQFALPRRWAFAPLVMAVCLLPNLPVLNVGLTFTPSKLLVLAGLLRASFGRNGAPLRRVALDFIVVAWALWAIASAMGHAPKDHNPLTVRLALAYDVGGSYLYVRLFIRTREDCERFMTCLAGVMVVVGASMTWEKMTGQTSATLSTVFRQRLLCGAGACARRVPL